MTIMAEMIGKAMLPSTWLHDDFMKEMMTITMMMTMMMMMMMMITHLVKSSSRCAPNPWQQSLT